VKIAQENILLSVWWDCYFELLEPNRIIIITF
jgi:hypothetical protein